MIDFIERHGELANEALIIAMVCAFTVYFGVILAAAIFERRKR